MINFKININKLPNVSEKNKIIAPASEMKLVARVMPRKPPHTHVVGVKALPWLISCMLSY